MKLLSSSSSTASFDANMCTSKSGTAGCLAGILRRILCSGSLPTHPSDQITDAGSTVFDFTTHQDSKPEEKIAASATPGLVARLMGLESVPDNSLVSSEIVTNSISRSRSMNSMDCREEFDQMPGKHRRVKTTMSFCETPIFVELENDEFFILSFENGGEAKELRSMGRKTEMGFATFGELKQREREKRKTKGNRAEKLSENTKTKTKKKEDNQEVKKMVLNEKYSRRISDKPTQKAVTSGKAKDSTNASPPLKASFEKPYVVPEAENGSQPIKNSKEISHGAKPRKKKNTHLCVVKSVEPECCSEDSSPVSVLDFAQHIIDPKVPTSEEDSNLAESNLRRKLSPELENYKHVPLSNGNNLIDEDRRTKTIEDKCFGSKKKGCHSENYMDMWDEICRLTEAEMAISNWVYRKLEDSEDISADFGSQILDQLLEDLVGQLAAFPMKQFEL